MKEKNKRLTGMLAGILSTLVITVALSSQAQAECFAGMGKWANPAAFSRIALPTTKIRSTDPKTAAANVPDNAAYPSIVGFWHVHYTGPMFPGGDQEAYQIFNTGGTEVHNPNTPTDGVCLGAWTQTANTVTLTHRVWLYDPIAGFIGVGHLNATITLSDKGTTQSGNFTLQIFDLAGNPITTALPGTLSGERITPN
jgi:hypothetical protein